MDRNAKEAAAQVLARELLKAEDIITGISMTKGFGYMTRREFLAVGRRALALIEEGRVK